MNKQERTKGRALLNFWYNESTLDERESGRVWYDEAKSYVKILSLRFELPEIIWSGISTVPKQ